MSTHIAVLTAELRLGRPDRFESHRLHIEPERQW